MDNDGLIAAYLFDGTGRGSIYSWDDIANWQADSGPLWVHLNRDSSIAQRWLQQHSGLEPLVVESLLAENTRPRCAPVGNGVMLFLRGVNLNPGADPEDMVSIRLWIEPLRIISVRIRHLLSVDDLRRALAEGRGPRDVGEFVAQLTDLLATRMSGAIGDVDDEVDRLQDQALETESRQLRTEVIHLRREIIALRRYLAPQRDALNRLIQTRPTWLDELNLLQIREEADRVTRFVEDLDAARERAAVTQEEINNNLAEQLNSRMYVLSVVAAIFLPLGFLTGLFGVNVGGIPLAEDPFGFVEISVLLLVITLLQIALFRWRRWL